MGLPALGVYQRNPRRSDRKVANNFNSAVARDKIDIAPVANVSHETSFLGRNNATIPATAATHASG